MSPALGGLPLVDHALRGPDRQVAGNGHRGAAGGDVALRGYQGHGGRAGLAAAQVDAGPLQAASPAARFTPSAVPGKTIPVENKS